MQEGMVMKEEYDNVIAVDFDGVISDYAGFKGKGVFADPVLGCKIFLDQLRYSGWTIIVNTTRIEVHQIAEYLAMHEIPYDHINHNPENIKQHLHPAKVLADVYLDDRAIRFTGRWSPELLAKINNHKPWWKEDK